MKHPGGRKPEICEMTRTAVVNRSWAIINAYLVEPDNVVPREEKVRIALQIALRTTPQPQAEQASEELINSQLEFKIPKNGKGLHRFGQYIHQ